MKHSSYKNLVFRANLFLKKHSNSLLHVLQLDLAAQYVDHEVVAGEVELLLGDEGIDQGVAPLGVVGVKVVVVVQVGTLGWLEILATHSLPIWKMPEMSLKTNLSPNLSTFLTFLACRVFPYPSSFIYPSC